jgi:hypothetical protein
MKPFLAPTFRAGFGLLLIAAIFVASCFGIREENAAADLRVAELEYASARMLVLEKELRETESARAELAEIVAEQLEELDRSMPTRDCRVRR